MYCKKCGLEIEIDSLYCSKCGARISGYAHSNNNPGSSNPEKVSIVETRKKKPLVLVIFIGWFIYLMIGVYLRYGAPESISYSFDRLMGSFSINSFYSMLGFFNFFIEIVSVLFASFAVVIFLIYIANTFIYWGSAVAVDAKRASFWMALLAQVVVFLASMIITLIFSFIPLVGTILGMIISFFIIPLILMGLFNTTYGGGFGIYFMNLICSAIGAILIIVFILQYLPF